MKNEQQFSQTPVMPSLTHGSLFSGIGGFDLAAEWMGWENIFHCEWNDFGQRVLKHYWPNALSYEDITKTDFTIHRGRINVLTGGFPCQPYSVAGKRKGKEDERHLWPEMLRAIREIQPDYVVGENVRGLINWNGGLVFDEVQADLEAEGYEVLPFLLPAGSVNAPHRRDRIWFVAFKNTDKNGRRSDKREKEPDNRQQRNACTGDNERISTNNDEVGAFTNSNGEQSKRMQPKQRKISEQEQREFRRSNCKNDASNTCNERCYNGCDNREERHFQNDFWITEENQSERNGWKCRTCEFGSVSSNADSGRQSSQEHRETESRQFAKKSLPGNWENFPTQSPICNGNDGIPTELDGITFPKWRNESIKAGGNAIVPQVAFQIFKAIAMHDASLSEA